MPTITFASSKGGAGKTTACLLLADTFSQKLQVTIIDADPAGRIVRWSQKGPHSQNITVVQCANENVIQATIKSAAEVADLVLIDLEGVASRLNTFAIANSDLVIVPMGDEQQDAEDAIMTIAQAEMDASISGREIPTRVLFMRTKAAVKSRIAKALNGEMRANVSTFETELHDRSAFSNIHNTGGGLRELPENVGGVEKAINNVENLAEEVITLLSKEHDYE